MFASRDPAKSAALMTALDAVQRAVRAGQIAGWRRASLSGLVDAAGQSLAMLHDARG
jgi:hypothetical protein